MTLVCITPSTLGRSSSTTLVPSSGVEQSSRRHELVAGQHYDVGEFAVGETHAFDVLGDIGRLAARISSMKR
jgi:hypothetical protein